MASRKPAVTPVDGEIDNDPLAESEPVEEPSVAPQPVLEQFPPAGHRVEQFETVRPDGVRVVVTRDIDTGEQRISVVDV